MAMGNTKDTEIYSNRAKRINLNAPLESPPSLWLLAEKIVPYLLVCSYSLIFMSNI